MIKHMEDDIRVSVGTENATEPVLTVEQEAQKDFTSRYEDVYKRFHNLKEKGNAGDIHEAFGDINYLIRLSGKEGNKYMDLVDDEDRDEEVEDEFQTARREYTSHLVSLKIKNPEMLAALEDELSIFEQKLTEKEEETGSEHTAATTPIESNPDYIQPAKPIAPDTEPSFVERVRREVEDEEAAIVMDGFLQELQEEEELRAEGVPITSPRPILDETQPTVPHPENITPPLMPPNFIAPPLEPPPIEVLRSHLETLRTPGPPMESLGPPTETVLKDEELARTQSQEFLIEEIRKEAQKIMDALKKPKNFDRANMGEYKESLNRMQAQRQELFLNIQNNLPRGSYVLGWRMTQFMRANKLLQGEAERFMNEVNKQGKPNIDRFKIAEKLYREWEHKVQKWYEDHGENWNLDHLVRKKVEKYKNNPQKLYKELKKASAKLDRRSTKMPEGDFWDVLENFNLLYTAFRETMSSTTEAQKVVSMFGRQLNGANTLRKIAETGKGNEGDVEEALRNYKNGVQERNKIKKVKIKPNGRKYTIDLKLKGGD